MTYKAFYGDIEVTVDNREFTFYCRKCRKNFEVSDEIMKLWKKGDGIIIPYPVSITRCPNCK